MEFALQLLIKVTQQQAFSSELALIHRKRPLPKPFRKLSPFIDDKGILRVGGRLKYSDITHEQKHPILLPSTHIFTTLVIKYTHSKYCHPGLQTLHFILSQRYWIISPRKTIRRIISKCYKCFRLNPKPVQQPMGNLPKCRISELKPFSHVGIDFCGPFRTTSTRMRGAKVTKSYICIFCCMSTKALHLELTSDLSSDAFLGALRRFVSRRGLCSDIYSDCGTNFKGAARQLSEIMQQVSGQEGIRFHFNPPSSPNFGGLWEAGVKSFKTHLFRVIGDQTLTFEELSTVVTQVEALLNSRPLCSLSSDPNDDSVLTPGHFLTLSPLNSVPEPNLGNIHLGRLSRWQMVQRLQQDFWKRWHKEYLHTLLQRSKWLEPSTPIELGTIVLLKEDHNPPMKWTRGRITQLHPGADGITRVVSVRNSQGTILKRPVSKVCPLPKF
ncbi:uncharacterized protein [Leptinotarsa decemlineata]|uniref:uncharacterized protein n=1 Tax=Leptinotarsa decemlineata TaxID=7539 RepID=UPI003D30938C